jgi:hypothetical protein
MAYIAYRSAGEKRMYQWVCESVFTLEHIMFFIVYHSHWMSHVRTHLHTHAQGDLPVGTLVSDPFKIDGTKISFLVGGGCNILEECVEQCTTLTRELR